MKASDQPDRQIIAEYFGMTIEQLERVEALLDELWEVVNSIHNRKSFDKALVFVFGCLIQWAEHPDLIVRLFSKKAIRKLAAEARAERDAELVELH